jgi:Peptidase family M28/PA domain
MNKYNTKLRRLGVLLGMVLVFSINETTVWADNKTDTNKLRSYVKHEGILEHLEALQKIANKNGGNRSVKATDYAGPNGELQTRNYIANSLKKADLDVTRQEVKFDFFHEITPAILERTSPSAFAYKEGDANSPNDFRITNKSAINNNINNVDVTAQIQAVDLVIPPGATPNTSNSGCEDVDFDGFTRGNIALIQRGTCGFVDKVLNAIKAGAVGVVLFNEGTPRANSGTVDRIGLVGSVLSPSALNPTPPPITIPVVFARFSVGEELYNLTVQSPNPVEVHLATNAEQIPTTTENIFGETKTGNPAQVVMAGTHLDSVDEGAGINDNGSGVATLLEIAKGMKALKISPKNKVRFAFWGAEEAGQEGSNHYVDGLSPEEKANIALYLNFDMMGSPNYVPSVYDSDGNSVRDSNGNPVGPIFGDPGGEQAGQVEDVLVEYFKRVNPRHAPPKLLQIDQRSDYTAFLLNDIPFAAITSGFDADKTVEEAKIFGGKAGKPYDACYHEACDTIRNVSKKSLDLMAGAAVHGIMTFATKDVIFPKPNLQICVCGDGTQIEMCAQVNCDSGPDQDEICGPVCATHGGERATGCRFNEPICLAP